jgi:hypothetical protein
MRGSRPSLVLRLLAAQAVVFTMVVSLPWVALAAVPGSLRPTGEVLCPDDKPDVHVVQYSETTSEGTGTSWTIVCMDERGAVEEVGSWAPLGVYLLGWFVLFEALVLPLVVLGWLRARRRYRRRPDGSPPGRRRRWAPDPGFRPPPVVPPAGAPGGSASFG